MAEHTIEVPTPTKRYLCHVGTGILSEVGTYARKAAGGNCACIVSDAPAASKTRLRSSGFSFTKSSISQGCAASRRMMSAIHAGADATSFTSRFRSSADNLRPSFFTVSSLTCALPRYRRA